MNNSGFGINSAFADTTEDEFDAVMNVHLKGVFFLTQRLLPLIEDGGRIVTDFGGGVVRDNPKVNLYIAASTAMGRAGLPDDIGGAIVSLLVGENQWVTAQRIEVSGGMNL